MKLLITGSRDWKDKKAIKNLLGIFPRDCIVIDGMARGADQLAYEAAKELGFVHFARFPAQWDKYRREGRTSQAGMDRNRLMFDITKPNAVLAFPLPQSKGTYGMMKYAESKGCPVIDYTRIDKS